MESRALKFTLGEQGPLSYVEGWSAVSYVEKAGRCILSGESGALHSTWGKQGVVSYVDRAGRCILHGERGAWYPTWREQSGISYVERAGCCILREGGGVVHLT